MLIVGAGLAGLSAAYALRDRPHLVVESEASVGGLCRSLRVDGFTFDFTGHLLHMKRPEIRELVFRLLPAKRRSYGSTAARACTRTGRSPITPFR